MKKLFLTLVLAFAFVSSYANEKNISDYMEITQNELSQILESDFNIKKTVVINEDFSCTITYGVYRSDGSYMGGFTVSAPDDHPDCGGFVGIKMR